MWAEATDCAHSDDTIRHEIAYTLYMMSLMSQLQTETEINLTRINNTVSNDTERRAVHLRQLSL